MRLATVLHATSIATLSSYSYLVVFCLSVCLFRFPKVDASSLISGIRIYWWRAIENGILVLQNETTGRLIAIPNRQQRLTGAVDTIVKCLSFMRDVAAIALESGGCVADDISSAAPEEAFITRDLEYPVQTDLSSTEIPDCDGKRIKSAVKRKKYLCIIIFNPQLSKVAKINAILMVTCVLI